MRNLLLVSVATVGIVAGTSYAYAQSNRAPGEAAGQEHSQAPEGGRGQPSQRVSPNQQQHKAATPAERNSRPETTGQAPATRNERQSGPEQGGAEPGAKGDRERPAANGAPERRREGNGETTGQANEHRDGNREFGQGPSHEVTGQAGRGAVTLSAEQRTKIRTTILRENVRPVTNVNFDVSVGTVVPRAIEVHPVPVDIVEIEPVWRGYMFFLVGEDVVIVDPGLRIVAVLPA